MDVLAVLGPLLLGLWWSFLLSRLSTLKCRLFRAWSSLFSSSPPGEGTESFLVVSFLLMVLMAPWLCGSCSLWRRLVSLRSLPRSALILLLAVLLFLMDLLTVLVDLPFLRHFQVARCPPGGEVSCMSFLTLAASSFSILAGSLGFFIAERRGLGRPR